MGHYALVYDVVDNFIERRKPFREAHLRPGARREWMPPPTLRTISSAKTIGSRDDGDNGITRSN
ncbi:MAG: hypothetical protein ACRD2I_17050 [Vicinamibacterales bacterium]